ncbi:MAG: PQQ-binding-like beta-propeller repeat protein [Acidobacteriota bacterium]
MKKVILAWCVIHLFSWGLAQEIGDQGTAGYTNSRTYLNADMGNFRPPLTLSETIELPGVVSAEALLVFSNENRRHFLVGEGGAETSQYRLFDAETGAQIWNVPFAGSPQPLNYIPAFDDDIVILGGPATTAVKAIRVSTGLELWEDNSVGDTSGRFPVLTNGLVVYQGAGAITAADPLIGPNPSFWSLATTTAESPISLLGQQAYTLDGSGTLRALDVRDGSTLWSASGFPGVNPNIISTEQLVFVNNTEDHIVSALRADDGSVAWMQQTGTLSETPGMGLAYDRLYLFIGDDGGGNAGLAALDPDTAQLLWSQSESGAGIDFGLVANNVVYYYHQATQRIRARDAFSGNLLWSIQEPDVRGLSAAGGSLNVLLANRVDVYRASNTIYFAHLADGDGQQTLVTLNNRTSETAMGTATFFGTAGSPLNLAIEGAGTTSNVAFTVPPGSSTSIQTLGGMTARSGWARVTSDRPLTGSSIFQFVDETTNEILFEGGVSDSPLAGRSNVFVLVEFPPLRPSLVSTGVAVANPLDETAMVVYRLLDSGGTETASVMEMFESGTQQARFVEELFPGQISDNFSGTLVIESDLPVAVTTLRTQGLLQLSSYQVGQ